MVVSPEQEANIRQRLGELESLLRPIERNGLTFRLKQFVAMHHYAFGDKTDRDLAVAGWAAQLSPYPEWAIKQMFDRMVRENDGKSIMTVGTALRHIERYLGDSYKMREGLNRILRDGILFDSMNDYFAYQDEKSRRASEEIRQHEERIAAARRNEEVNQLAILAIEVETQLNIERAKEKLANERREQLGKMKSAAKVLKDNRRLKELWAEFESILEEGQMVGTL